jgi:hypothetical protein
LALVSAALSFEVLVPDLEWLEDVSKHEALVRDHP